ncbi:phage exclusion protein Lit family protein [Mucilaginibacter lacusdianchii]|uniref:phage exclusion protein Lit family protein n=1 Tax=Mucilaginibacter lacusdianchii TaxID=2684211 RepID=UPI00131CDDCB|nr:phage exclusion protein Lit family protein [Mucilaginibacter sp. JXJ CY 39]
MPVSKLRNKYSKAKKKKIVISRKIVFKNAISKRDERGILPVRTLCYNFSELFFNISPDFKSEFDVEVASGLSDKIHYKISAQPVREVAELKSYKEPGEVKSIQEIVLYENYNQFLWSLCYSLLVLFDKGIHEPRLNGVYRGTFVDTKQVREAWEVFKAGISLTTEFKRTIFFALPNPEMDSNRKYVSLANAIYCAALEFILLHEFGHQFFGHYADDPNPEQSKEHEFLVDDFAIEKMSAHFSKKDGPTLKAGILFGTLSFFFLDRRINGGDTHPDLDDRLIEIVDKLELNELDNLWGIASLGINLWGHHFNHNIKIPRIGETYQALFKDTVKDLKRFK